MRLDAILSLDKSGFVNPLAGAQAAMRSAIGGLAALAGASLSVAGAVAGFKKALDFGGEMSDLSAVTGTSVGQLVVLRQAFEDAGVGAGSVRQVLSLMQRSFSGMNEGSGRTADTFKSLGLDMDKLRAMAPTDALKTIGAAIGKIGSESDKTAATMAIFGRSGAQLKSFFADPAAIDTASRSLGNLPAIMQRNAKLFDDLSDSIGRIKAKGMGLFAGIAEGALPAVGGIQDALDGIDLSGLGQRIGDTIATVTQIFRDGRAGEALGLSLKIAFKEAINLFATGMERAGVGVLAIFSSASLWKGAWDMIAGGLQGAFAGLAGTLTRVFSAPIIYLRTSMDKIMGELFEAIGKIPGVGKLLGVEGFQAKTMGEYMAENEVSVKAAGDALLGVSKDEFARAGDGLKTAAAGAREIMATIMAVEPIKIFDPAQEEAELENLWASVKGKVAETRRAMQKAAAPAKAAAGAEASELGGKASGKYDVASDSLSKIGLYVGGAGALADPMRRVATNTERQIRVLERVAGILTTRPPAQMAPA